MNLAELQTERLRIVSTLRALSAQLDQADAAGNEPEYDRLKALHSAAGNDLDALLIQIDQAVLLPFSQYFNKSYFAAAFQVAGPHEGEWLIAEPETMRIACRVDTREAALIRAKEMCHFRAQRKQAERDHAKPLNLSYRR